MKTKYIFLITDHHITGTEILSDMKSIHVVAEPGLETMVPVIIEVLFTHQLHLRICLGTKW